MPAGALLAALLALFAAGLALRLAAAAGAWVVFVVTGRWPLRL